MMELQVFNKSSLKQLERSDNDIKFWIEFYSYSSLIYFYNGFIFPNEGNMKYWGTNSTNTNKQFNTSMPHRLPLDKRFLTLLKLKRVSANEDLPERFNVSSKYTAKRLT